MATRVTANNGNVTTAAEMLAPMAMETMAVETTMMVTVVAMMTTTTMTTTMVAAAAVAADNNVGIIKNMVD